MTFCSWLSAPFPCLPGKFEVSKPSESKSDNKKDALQVVTSESWEVNNDDDNNGKSAQNNGVSEPGEKHETRSLKGLRFESMDSPKPAGANNVTWSVPLNDHDNSPASSKLSAMNSNNMMTLRLDPRMRLITAASSISDFDMNESSEHSGDSSGDWSMTGDMAEPSGQVFDVGLMITIDDGRCEFQLAPDTNYGEIHPNAYGPANVTNLRVLYGGGSGVSVFGGHHPRLGDIVMKHGGYKDAEDLFALATISEELRLRGKLLGQVSAAQHMQEQLPSFKMIYLSPNHVMDRGKELVSKLKNFVRNWSMTSVPSGNSLAPTTPKMKRLSVVVEEQQPQLNIGMTIRIFEGEGEDKPSFVLNTHSVPPKLSLVLPAGSTEYLSAKRIQVHGNAYDALRSVVEGLTTIMTARMFKFTLAQKTIGGPHPKTGNQWLYEGKLSGPVLKNLMDQMILVIQNLQKLTMPEEVDVVESILEEVERFECDESHLRAHDISPTADSFVGNAIKKNFHPEKGRQRFLLEFCTQFREGGLLLTPEEEQPAKHLANLLRSGALMSDTFLNAPMEPAILQVHAHVWRNIIRRAVESRRGMSKAALQRIWTCGLTDAGIHNLFISETELYMFDLGEPQLMSLPGFLTKFLFSFFHTLGMEDDGDGSWVRRFDVVGDKLALSIATQELLPKAYDAFEECLNRVISELFDDDRRMRWILLQYITLQLLSDTAFCVQKWQVKGGGKTREGNHQKNQEKWLWRALWDTYVAFDINTSDSWYRLDVLHPHHQEGEEDDECR